MWEWLLKALLSKKTGGMLGGGGAGAASADPTFVGPPEPAKPTENASMPVVGMEKPLNTPESTPNNDPYGVKPSTGQNVLRTIAAIAGFRGGVGQGLSVLDYFNKQDQQAADARSQAAALNLDPAQARAMFPGQIPEHPPLRAVPDMSQDITDSNITRPSRPNRAVDFPIKPEDLYKARLATEMADRARLEFGQGFTPARSVMSADQAMRTGLPTDSTEHTNIVKQTIAANPISDKQTTATSYTASGMTVGATDLPFTSHPMSWDQAHAMEVASGYGKTYYPSEDPNKVIVHVSKLDNSENPYLKRAESIKQLFPDMPEEEFQSIVTGRTSSESAEKKFYEGLADTKGSKLSPDELMQARGYWTTLTRPTKPGDAAFAAQDKLAGIDPPKSYEVFRENLVPKRTQIDNLLKDAFGSAPVTPETSTEINTLDQAPAGLSDEGIQALKKAGLYDKAKQAGLLDVPAAMISAPVENPNPSPSPGFQSTIPNPSPGRQNMPFTKGPPAKFSDFAPTPPMVPPVAAPGPSSKPPTAGTMAPNSAEILTPQKPTLESFKENPIPALTKEINLVTIKSGPTEAGKHLAIAMNQISMSDTQKLEVLSSIIEKIEIPKIKGVEPDAIKLEIYKTAIAGLEK